MSTQPASAITKLDTLRTVFGTNLGNLVAFASEFHYDGTTKKYDWDQTSDGPSNAEAANALAACGAGVQMPRYLIDNTNQKIYVSKTYWDALHAAKSSALVKPIGFDAFYETASGSGVMCLDAANTSWLWTAQNFKNQMVLDGFADTSEFVRCDTPVVKPTSAGDLAEKIVATTGTLAGDVFNAHAADIVLRTLQQGAAALKTRGDIAWKLYDALAHVPAGAADVTVAIASDALKAALAGVNASLAESLAAGQSSVTVSRDVLAQMAVELRRDLPVATSALLEAQLAALPSGNGLQLVDMSAWLGSALYNADGSATGLFNILKLEGFDPSVSISTLTSQTLQKREAARQAMSAQDLQAFNALAASLSAALLNPAAKTDRYGRIQITVGDPDGTSGVAPWGAITRLLNPLMDTSLPSITYSAYYHQEASADVCQLGYEKYVNYADTGIYVRPELLKQMVLATKTTLATLTELSGDLVRNTATNLTEATAETIQSWATELAGGGAYDDGEPDALVTPKLYVPEGLTAMSATARSAAIAARDAAASGLVDLAVFEKKLPYDPTVTSDRKINTAIGVVGAATSKIFAEIAAATGTSQSMWKLTLDATTNTYWIAESEVQALQSMASHRWENNAAGVAIDDLLAKETSALKVQKNNQVFIVLAGNEADGKALLARIKDLGVALYAPLAEKDIGSAKLGATAWVYDSASGQNRLVATAETIDYALANLQAIQQKADSLCLKDRLDVLRPDDENAVIDLGAWTGDGRGAGDQWLATLSASAALVSDRKAVTSFDTDTVGTPQLMTIGGQPHLVINRATLDTWSCELALNAAMLDEIESGQVGSWGAAYVKYAAPHSGKMDVARARVAYSVSSFSRNCVWFRKNMALERQYQTVNFVVNPLIGDFNKTMKGISEELKKTIREVSGDDVTNQYREQRFRDFANDYDGKLRRCVMSACESIGLEPSDAQKAVIGRTKDLLLSVIGGLDLDSVSESSADLAAFEDAVAKVTIRAMSSISDALVQGQKDVVKILEERRNTISAAFRSKAQYYEVTKEGMQVDRAVSGAVLVGWSIGGFAQLAGLVEDDPSNTAAIAYQALTVSQVFALGMQMPVWYLSNLVDVAGNNSQLFMRNEELFRRGLEQKFSYVVNGETVYPDVWDAYVALHEARNSAGWADSVYKFNTKIVDVTYGGKQYSRYKLDGAYQVGFDGQGAQTLEYRSADGSSIKLPLAAVAVWQQMGDEMRANISLDAMVVACNNYEAISKTVGATVLRSDADILSFVRSQLANPAQLDGLDQATRDNLLKIIKGEPGALMTDAMDAVDADQRFLLKGNKTLTSLRGSAALREQPLMGSDGLWEMIKQRCGYLCMPVVQQTQLDGMKDLLLNYAKNILGHDIDRNTLVGDQADLYDDSMDARRAAAKLGDQFDLKLLTDGDLRTQEYFAMRSRVNTVGENNVLSLGSDGFIGSGVQYNAVTKQMEAYVTKATINNIALLQPGVYADIYSKNSLHQWWDRVITEFSPVKSIATEWRGVWRSIQDIFTWPDHVSAEDEVGKILGSRKSFNLRDLWALYRDRNKKLFKRGDGSYETAAVDEAYPHRVEAYDEAEITLTFGTKEVTVIRNKVSGRAVLQGNMERLWGIGRYGCSLIGDVLGLGAGIAGIAIAARSAESASDSYTRSFYLDDLAKQTMMTTANFGLVFAHGGVALTKGTLFGNYGLQRTFHQGVGVGFQIACSVVTIMSEAANIDAYAKRIDKARAIQTQDMEANLGMFGSCVNIATSMAALACSFVAGPVGLVVGLLPLVVPNFGEFGRADDLRDQANQLRKEGRDHEADLLMTMATAATISGIPVVNWGGSLFQDHMMRAVFTSGGDMTTVLNGTLPGLYGIKKGLDDAESGAYTGVSYAGSNYYTSADGRGEWVVPVNPYLVPNFDSNWVAAVNTGLQFPLTDPATLGVNKSLLKQSAQQMENRMQAQAAGTQDWFKEAFKERTVSSVEHAPDAVSLGKESLETAQSTVDSWKPYADLWLSSWTGSPPYDAWAESNFETMVGNKMYEFSQFGLNNLDYAKRLYCALRDGCGIQRPDPNGAKRLAQYMAYVLKPSYEAAQAGLVQAQVSHDYLVAHATDGQVDFKSELDSVWLPMLQDGKQVTDLFVVESRSEDFLYGTNIRTRTKAYSDYSTHSTVGNDEWVDASVVTHLGRPASEDLWASIEAPEMPSATAGQAAWDAYKAALTARYARVSNTTSLVDGGTTSAPEYAVSASLDKLGFSMDYLFYDPATDGDHWKFTKAQLIRRPTDTAGREVAFTVRNQNGNDNRKLFIDSTDIDDETQRFDIERKNVTVNSGAGDDMFLLSTTEGIVIDGGDGDDTAILMAKSGQSVSLNNFRNVEKVIGTAQSDTVTATDDLDHEYVWQALSGDTTAAPDTVTLTGTGVNQVTIGAGTVRTGSNTDLVAVAVAKAAFIDVDTGGGVDNLSLGYLGKVTVTRDMTNGDYTFSVADTGQRGAFRNVEMLVATAGGDNITLAGGVSELLANDGDDDITINNGDVLVDGGAGSDNISVNSADRTTLVSNEGADKITLGANVRDVLIGIGADGTSDADGLEKTVDATHAGASAEVVIDVGKGGKVKVLAGGGKLTINLLDPDAKVEIDEATVVAGRAIRINYLPEVAKVDDLTFRQAIVGTGGDGATLAVGASWGPASGFAIGAVTYKGGATTQSATSALWQGITINVTDLLGNPVVIDMAALRLQNVTTQVTASASVFDKQLADQRCAVGSEASFTLPSDPLVGAYTAAQLAARRAALAAQRDALKAAPGTLSATELADALSAYIQQIASLRAYSLLLADGRSLPDWISFDPTTMTVSVKANPASDDVMLCLKGYNDQGVVTQSETFMLRRDPYCGNVAVGSDGNDMLSDNGGPTLMSGGAGDDTYIVSNSKSIVNAGSYADGSGDTGGVDTVISSISFDLAGSQVFGQIENLTLTGAANIDGSGNALANVIVGNSGANHLYGLAGNDTLSGGSGNDTLYGGDGDDVLSGGGGKDVIVGENGTDTVLLQGSPSEYCIVQHGDSLMIGDRKANGNPTVRDGLLKVTGVEQFTFAGSGQTLTLAQLPNVMTAQQYINHYVDLVAAFKSDAAAGFLHYWNYGFGEQRLTGGENRSDLWKYLASNSDLMSAFGADISKAQSHLESCGANEMVYGLPLSWGGDLQSGGRRCYDPSLAIQVVTSSNHTLIGGAGNDGLFGLDGSDSLSGGAGNDGLSGGAGNDTLDGGAGEDRMAGGNGNDLYRVDNARDVVDEIYNDGIDTVESSISFSLLPGAQVRGNIENLILTGTANIDGTGNALNNVITGNSGANHLYGLDGNDTLSGAGGNDSLYGGNGNDSLVGGAGDDELNGDAGADTMLGGAGNDSYAVDNSGDMVIEYADEGTDLVRSSVDYTLTDNVENLTLIGTAINGVGNRLNNLIVGNVGNNNLSGGRGNDTLIGGDGDDNLITGDIDDYVISGQTVASLSDSLDGGNGNDSLYGGKGNDMLSGGDGSDTLVGGAGLDTLNGGAGNDYLISGVYNDYLPDLLDGGDGNDTLYGGDSYFDTLNGGAGADVLFGNGGCDILNGGDGNDTLDGGDDGDTLDGGAGDDALLGGNGDDSLHGGIGNDSLNGGGGCDWLFGDDGDDTLNGDAGNDSLNGGAGNDLMNGGDGDDLLYGGGGKDVIDGGAGTDSLLLLGCPSEYDGIQWGDWLMIVDHAANGNPTVRDGLVKAIGVEKIGFVGSNQMVAVSQLFFMTAQQYINHYADLVAAFKTDAAAGFQHYWNYGFGEKRLTGNEDRSDLWKYLASNSDLMSAFGADISKAQSHLESCGANEMVNGQPLSSGGDLQSGRRRCYDSSLAIQVVTSSNHTLTGGAGNDGLFGLDGNDSLSGGAGNDGLSGGAGNDTLDGGAGEDRMAGGNGNDLYRVDNAKDVVDEIYNDGIDTVESSISFSLEPGAQVRGDIENLTLIGSANIDGTGNALNNVITGNSGANHLYGQDGNDTLSGADGNDSLYGGNGDDSLDGGAGNDVLDGGAGADTMVGGAGNDVYVIDDKYGDKVLEAVGGGIDTVLIKTGPGGYSLRGWVSSNPEGTAGQDVEAAIALKDVNGAMNLHGNALNNVLWGNDWGSTLQGYEGNDILYGAGGDDRLEGGAGNDIYRFDGSCGNDLIVETDATPGNRDTLYIDARADQLKFRQSGNDLVIEITGAQSPNSVTIQSHYVGTQFQVERFVSSDGKVLAAANADSIVKGLSSPWVSDVTVSNLINAMAQMAPPSAGTTLTPTDYQNRVTAIYAANVMV